jgi:hypothetical protein
MNGSVPTSWPVDVPIESAAFSASTTRATPKSRIFGWAGTYRV